MTRPRAAALACVLSAILAACSTAVLGPTAADAETFVGDAEVRLLSLRREAARAAWVRENFVTGDTTALAAEAAASLTAATAELARAAAHFDRLDLPEPTARKLELLKTGPATVAPSHPPLQEELADLLAELERTYRAGAYCAGASADCLERAALERTAAELRDTDRLLDLWDEGRALAPAMRPRYERLVEIANAGAVELGHADAGERWRSAYGLPPDAFPAELDRLWRQVRPLYESLHCLVRGGLGDEYGTAITPPGEAIPAHLLGDMGNGHWSGLYDMVAPRTRGRGYDLTRQIERNRVDPLEMVGYGEGFFGSLGFDPLPAAFRERSLFVQPADRDVVCSPSAWNVDGENDVRIKMCIEANGDSFVAVHRELARAHYQWAYRVQDPLLRTGANDAFLVATGDAVALSVTPEYLVEVDLLDRPPPTAGDVPFLLRRALDEIASLPFALLVDRWRWQVFAGEVTPDRYNRSWWELREEYQGIRAPAPRTTADFDPGTARHVAANSPLSRDFLAGILRFQLHGALCAVAGADGPLHRCSIFGSREAGARLRAMMEMGASRPWPEALETVTGTQQMDASALLNYFAPLSAWLDEQNAGRACGW